MDLLRELHEAGFTILRAHFAPRLLEDCREAFWPLLLEHLKTNQPNRGENRFFLPMPFDPPCFAPEFFFDAEVLNLVRSAMDDRIVADQWGCDVPIQGSTHQNFHVDYQRPLFAESPSMLLPPYMLVVSFGLREIGLDDGPIEIAPGTHRMPRTEALRAMPPTTLVTLQPGDVLIRHPWALHRGTPNLTDTPRALLTIRYVRRWYADWSREVQSIPPAVWQSLTPEQQSLMRFPRTGVVFEK
jgi:ectoine hydroxylase-related dioxygenase (phytanoyl-CoA dioxygenase family)